MAKWSFWDQLTQLALVDCPIAFSLATHAKKTTAFLSIGISFANRLKKKGGGSLKFF